MNEQKVRDILSGRKGGAMAACLRAGLWAASKPYAGAMRLRRWAYRAGVLRSRAAAAPVICVGNLTTGGTGKTPMVAWVVSRLKEAGRRPAVLTRGYRGAQAAGQGAPPLPGDEARLLEALTGVPVIVNADRQAGAAAAVAAGADVLVMDDGFQHLRLRRNLDIVLIDAAEPWGFGHCLPRGLLREGPSALGDAHAVVVTHSDRAALEAMGRLDERLRALAPRASRHAAVHAPKHLLDEMGRAWPLGSLLGRPVLAFCGLAAPDHFFAMLEALGMHLAGRVPLADHALYTQAVLDDLAAESARRGADLLVTTPKDHVKLAGLNPPAPVWQLVVEMELTGGQNELVERVLAAAEGRSAPPGG